MKHAFISFLSVVVISVSSGIQAQTARQFTDWTIKSGANSEAIRAAFLGKSQGQAYFLLENFPIRKVWPISELDTASKAKMLESVNTSNAPCFTFDQDALIGKWTLSEVSSSPVFRGNGFVTFPSGHFEVHGLRIGMTDTEVAQALVNIGAEILPVTTTLSSETRRLEKNGELPKAEKKYVTSQMNAILHRNQTGSAVTDWVAIEKKDYQETRTFKLQFLEDISVVPSRAVLISLTMGVSVDGQSAPEISDLLKKTMSSKYGSHNDLGAWTHAHTIGKNKGTEEVGINPYGTLILTGESLSRVFNENEELLEKMNKSAGPKGLDF